jgi:hypothetical protein
MKITKQYYNDRQMTDMNSLMNAMVLKPAELTPIITNLAGREDKKFPLSTLTQGVGNYKVIDQLEYDYRVTTRVTQTRPLAQTNDTAELGKGGKPFVLSFPDRWFIKDYTLMSQSMVQVRIMSEPVPNGSNYDYTVQLVKPHTDLFLPAEDATAGALFGQLYAPVGQDFSRGNASNWSSPSLIRHKLTTIRKSYQLSGNAKDAVAAFDLPKRGGGTTRFWMDYEEYQKWLQWMEEVEMFMWYAEQSYTEGGVTPMKDERGQPVTIGPGLLEQIINKDTYSVMTESKLEQVVGDLFYGMTDAQNMNVTLYTGTGGMREFDRAMKNKLSADSYRQFNDGKFVSGSGRELAMTGFFTRYEHVDGHTVNVVKVPLFDHGPVADARRKHPISGYSLESYRMVFVDQSTYEGEANLISVAKKNREFIRWGVAGSIVPNGFQGTDLRASDIDGASVHYLKTCGICLRRFDTSLDLQCVAA